MVLLKQNGLTVSIDNGIWNFSDGKKSGLYIPADEYWAVATDFSNKTPTKWFYGKIEHVENVYNGVILTGKIQLPDGELFCQDSCFFSKNLLNIRRRWQYTGNKTDKITLSYRFRYSDPSARILLPGVLYYGNPSGKDSGKVPFVNRSPGEKAFFEEHRLPMPFICAENSKIFSMAAIHTTPSPVPRASRPDSWWSLGVQYENKYTELAGYSGFVSCNGVDGNIKCSQNEFVELPGNGMSFIDQMIVEKSFALQLNSDTNIGEAFLPAVNAALEKHIVNSLPVDMEDLLRRKYNYALQREFNQGNITGSLQNLVERAPKQILFGWTGRSETMGFAAPVLGKFCGDNEAEKRAEKYFDFLISSPVDENGFYVRYFLEEGVFKDQNFVSQGQAMETFAMALKRLKQNGEALPEKYLNFLQKVCSSWYQRIMDDSWYPKSTNEAFLAAPLAMASELLNEKIFADCAIKIADHYITRHQTMTEPYWGGTLDAKCEDKEGAAAAMTAFFAVYELTGKKTYLAAAEHACGVFLTYLQIWDIPMVPGRLSDNFFRSAGWTAVSVQNMHLDIYGVWMAPLVWKIGKALNRPSWQRLALPMIINCGQLTDIYGSSGEQVDQTNFSQQHNRTTLDTFRGGYAEHWVVFWLTAAFLNAAAQFELMGHSFFAQKN